MNASVRDYPFFVAERVDVVASMYLADCRAEASGGVMVVCRVCVMSASQNMQL